MKLFLDTANLDEIKQINEWGVLKGITTNPSLIFKEKPTDWISHAKQICDIVDGPVSLETTTQTTKELIEEGHQLAAVAPNAIVKIVMTPIGLGAISALSAEGIKVNVTLVFSPNQAILAAEAGAYIVSPFLGRLDDISSDGTAALAEICEIYDAQGYETQVLAASLRHPMHVIEAARLGAEIASMPYKVFTQLVKHPLTDAGIKTFNDDWESLRANMEKEKG
ncbi:MAG: fructose-6-phosphate aldolase [Actinomycetota bacterium]|nr:fructose-6-phosphate aldolase [Actinomycetota bacterium]